MSLPSPISAIEKTGQVVGGGAPEAIHNVLNPQNPFGDQNINQMYDLLRSMLTRQGGQAVQGAQQTAGALAGSRGLVNPSGFITGAGTQAYAPFIQALLQGEMGRAGALQQNLGNRVAFDQRSAQERNQLNQQLNPWNQLAPILSLIPAFAGIPGIGKFLGIGGNAPTMQGGGGQVSYTPSYGATNYTTNTNR